MYKEVVYFKNADNYSTCLFEIGVCSPGCPRTCYLDHTGLKLTEICLSLSLTVLS